MPGIGVGHAEHLWDTDLVEDGWLDGDVPLHYVQWCPTDKAREPSLLLIHGTSSNALYWTRLARYLGDRRVVALDLRGHGRSAHPESGYSVEEMAADAARAVDRLGLEHSLLVGHSFGVAVALQLASARPNLITGAVLVDGPVSSLSKCLSWPEAERQMRTPSPIYQDLGEAEAAQAGLLGPAWGDDLRDFVRAGFRRTEAGWVPMLPEGPRLEMLQSLYDFYPDDLLPRVRGPVLMVMGSNSVDGVAPDVLACWRTGAEHAVRHSQLGRVITYPSQHDIPLVKPIELAGGVKQTAVQTASFSGLPNRVP
ncbi:MAG: alpha/beta hydrolase [Actinomycetota bacterium]|nr:alpha/beta hydrolase [Candidatus Dormibacteraeota bacterium]MDQ6949715.1 alpha/beta hydrolase [Actinomycetota bacterium]